MSIAMKDWEAGHFQDRVGEVFTVESAGNAEAASVLMELICVGRSAAPGGAAAGMRAESFGLLFRTVERQVLPPGLSRFVHAEFAPDEVYLVRVMPPAGMSTDQVYYEAIFG